MFVDRNGQGLICKACFSPQYEGQEEVADDNAELTAFLSDPLVSLPLEEYAIQQVGKLDLAVRSYVSERYPQHRQLTLSKLQTDARLANNQEAVDYLQQCWDWMASVFVFYYTREDAITEIAQSGSSDLDKKLAMKQVVAALDLTPFNATDPNVTVRHALELISPDIFPSSSSSSSSSS